MFFLVLTTVIVISIMTLVTVIFKNNSDNQQKDRERREKLAVTLKRYMQDCPNKNDWWMSDIEGSPENEYLRMRLAYTNVQNAIFSIRNINPLCKEISSTFSNIVISRYGDIGSKRVYARGEIQSENMPNVTEICFISQKYFAIPEFPSFFFYYSTWRSLMIAGVSWPQTCFHGILARELGHALRQKNGSDTDPHSEEWIKEEVEMHELELDVINHETTNSYSREINKILDRYATRTPTKEILASLTDNDLTQLDRIMGTLSYGKEVRGMSVATHLVSLGFKQIDRQKGVIKEKIDLYLWIVKTS